ncbi:MAG: bifunctional hydroxymethylpyrimidine kinase/phosphomethylpyrimidine kinase [Clostridia bacterium]|nr:bifunctional hydroxymethylpyrimidine kinase/phosphomethylpyrimidine kinase [Clostridia bacterium]
MKTILLLGDITGRSRVALRMLSRVLEDRGREVLMLPTALISNTLNLGRHEALDTTDYLLRSLDTWHALGIVYDLAYIGYITGREQAEKLCAVADELRAQGVPVVLDPILGDGGKRYNSVSDGQLAGMRLLCRHADLITPNMTEACLLLGAEYDAKQGAAHARSLSKDGCDVLITSCETQTGSAAMTGFLADVQAEFVIPFEHVPGHHWGTGDLFTGLLIDGLLSGKRLEDAAREAGEHVARQLRGEEKSMLPEQ